MRRRQYVVCTYVPRVVCSCVLQPATYTAYGSHDHSIYICTLALNAYIRSGFNQIHTPFACLRDRCYMQKQANFASSLESLVVCINFEDTLNLNKSEQQHLGQDGSPVCTNGYLLHTQCSSTQTCPCYCLPAHLSN